MLLKSLLSLVFLIGSTSLFAMYDRNRNELFLCASEIPTEVLDVIAKNWIRLERKNHQVPAGEEECNHYVYTVANKESYHFSYSDLTTGNDVLTYFAKMYPDIDANRATEDLVLLYSGKWLDNNLNLKELGLTSDTTLQIVRKQY